MTNRHLAAAVAVRAESLRARGELVPPPSETFDVTKLAFSNNAKVKTLGEFESDQLRAIVDPSRSVAICCGRQSGKTQAAAWRHTAKALAHPGSLQVFIAPDRGWAKRIIWETLTDLNERYNLQAVESLSDLSIRYPNGAVVALMGADNEKERKKIRGIHPIDVTLDEAQAFPFWLEDFIRSDIRPAQRNVRGRLTVQGTPPASLEHPWYKAVWRSKTYSKHQWNITHWPKALYKRLFGQSAEAALAEDLEDRGVTADDITFRREMLGEFLADENALAYRFDLSKNLWVPPPPVIDHTTIGVDLGWHDATAISVLGWGDDSQSCYEMHDESASQVTLPELAVALKRLAAIWNPALCFVDSQGNRQGFETIKEQLQREDVPIRLERRPVLPVADQVGLINQALQAGRLKLLEGSRAASDMRLVTWNKGIAGTTLDAGFHSDAIPALTYAYQAAVPLLPAAPPKPAVRPDAARHPPGFDPEQWARNKAKNDNRPWWEMAERGIVDESPGAFFDE